GQPRQRYPVPEGRRPECPANILPGQALVDLKAIGHIDRVIIVNKRMAPYLPVHGQGGRGEAKRHQIPSFSRADSHYYRSTDPPGSLKGGYVVAQTGPVGPQLEYTLVLSLGFGHSSGLFQRQPQPLMGFGIIRLAYHNYSELVGRGFHLS